MMVSTTTTIDFMAGLRGQLLVDEPMSKHTSWRVGGMADYFYTPFDKEDLIRLLHQLPADMPIYWIGLGSNLLVRDGGVSGLVLRTSKGLSQIRKVGADRVYAEAGVSCAKVAKTTVGFGLTGVEFLSGVPGTFGGAIAMNAGAFGGEIWPRIAKIDCVNRMGECLSFTNEDIKYGYREVDLPEDCWVIGGEIKLDHAEEDTKGKQKIRSLLDKRGASQPIQSANAGSVFRNPQGGFAAKLIEECGLKGEAIGGARISHTHANFIINENKATAEDIESLIDLIINRVAQQHNITLEPEVRVVGRPA